MNTNILKTTIIGLLSVLLATNLWSQERVTVSVEEFESLSVTGGINLVLVQDTSTYLILEGEKAGKEALNMKMKDNKLSISPNHESDFEIETVYFHKKEFKLIKISSYGSLTNKGTIKGEELKIITSGASELDLNLDYKICKMDLSGATEVNLEGKIDSLFVKSSGASEIDAPDVENIYSNINASGASDIYVNPKEVLIADLSGASSLKYDTDPETKEINSSGLSWNGIDSDGDDVDIDVEDIIIDKITGKNKTNFKGNWAGLEFGINTYMTPDNDFDYSNANSFMELDYGKSIQFNLNFFQKSINLIKSKVGLVTGMGFQFYNYRFNSNNVLLSIDTNNQFSGILDNNPDRTYTKSKRNVSYVVIPLILEFQTNNKHKANSFHISAGAVAGFKMGSNAKNHFTNSFGADSELYTYDDFNINPFKLDLTARLGWNFLNFYANYSLVEMFRENKGPELYPVSAGIVIPF